MHLSDPWLQRLNHSLASCIMCLVMFLYSGCTTPTGQPGRLDILFLGVDTADQHAEHLAGVLLQEYFTEGINITYSNDPEILTERELHFYDALILYGKTNPLSDTAVSALTSFVKSGKGLIALDSTSPAIRESAELQELVGGEGSKKEYGKGRVFHLHGSEDSAAGHAGLVKELKRAVLWAVGETGLKKLSSFPIAALEYLPGPVPNYEKRDPAPQVQKALSPSESMSLMQVPVGFHLELFASEPDIVNPVFMNWDERGRLWVIETVDYPNEVKEDDTGDDRIKILEDTDGDGRADKFTVFADKLNIPTSFVFINGGIMVSMAPSFLYLKDTDGDDRSDVRTVLLTGWGKSDTHAQASNLRYGHDNMIWGTIGYSGFEGMVGADSIKFGNGLFRFRPDGSELEYLSSTTNNTWGLGFSEEFDVFVSTANNTHSGFFGIPKRYSDKANIKEPGIDKIDAHYAMHVATKNLRQVDVHGGFTAAAGHSLYTARNFPEEYWNRIAFVAEPTGRLIHRTVLQQEGAGFMESGDGWNMLVSADEWVGPVQAEIGPDGALWIADWYDFIIQHNPTPTQEKAGLDAVNGTGNAYINPLRDRRHGRIYRLAFIEKDERNKLSLSSDKTEELISTLSNPNMFWRLTAQRLLVEGKNKGVLPALYKLIEDNSVDATGINAPAIHALWTMHGLHALDGSDSLALRVATGALKHPAAGVRKAAIEVLPCTTYLLPELTKADVFHDKDLRVRLAAVLALTELPASVDIARRLAVMANDEQNSTDKWIKRALVIAVTLNKEEFFKTYTGDQFSDLITKGVVNSAPSSSQSLRVDQTITLSVLRDKMKFDKELIPTRAGTTVRIVLSNPDFMQHNLVVIKPKTLEKVGAAADQLARDPEGAKMQYVPNLVEVIAATPLVNPGGEVSVTFRMPAQPGDYPFVCTFPGHWRMMNGILRVR